MTIKRINPETMHSNPAYTQVATVTNPKTWVFVGGQNSVDKEGNVVGKDIGSQSAQAYKNVMTALEAAGATMDDVFKMTIYIVQGNSIEEGFAGVMKVQPKKYAAPTISVVVVAALGNPDFLVEIEAVAAL